MRDPVLHVIAGPNGAGKSTLYDEVVGPATHLEFINADLIAQGEWPENPESKAYEAAELASERRADLLSRRVSFVTETVFSHESKVTLVTTASEAGYLVTLHVVMIPVELAVARVRSRVQYGGHSVPENKIRERYDRLWLLVATAVREVERAIFYDNSRAEEPFRVVAIFDRGAIVGEPEWPSWAPAPVREAAGL